MINNCMEEIIALDQQIFLYLNNLGTFSWDSFWLFMTNKWSSIPLYIFLLVLCLLKFQWKRTLLILLFVALLITVTDQLANLFKYGFERLRPCYENDIALQMRLVKSYCGGKFGYFSGHASNSFAVATFFSLLFKPFYKTLPYGLIIWALIVSYSRIYIGVHYPLDVITGIFMGSLLGFGFYTIFQKAKNK